MPGFRGAKRGRSDRYNWRHQQERARLKPTVDAGNAWCQQGLPGNGSSGTCLHPTRWIRPGTPWHAGHNDAGTAYIGPTHALCNQRAAAAQGARVANARRNTQRTITRGAQRQRTDLPHW